RGCTSPVTTVCAPSDGGALSGSAATGVRVSLSLSAETAVPAVSVGSASCSGFAIAPPCRLQRSAASYCADVRWGTPESHGTLPNQSEFRQVGRTGSDDLRESLRGPPHTASSPRTVSTTWTPAKTVK